MIFGRRLALQRRLSFFPSTAELLLNAHYVDGNLYRTFCYPLSKE